MVEVTSRGLTAIPETEEDPVKVALDQINDVNKHLIDLNSEEGEYPKHDWVPVSAFVTFESDNDYDKALKQIKQITVGGLKCNITQAPEPETLRWDHLEYSWVNRTLRDAVIFFTTAGMLFLGVFLITRSNVLKEVREILILTSTSPQPHLTLSPDPCHRRSPTPTTARR